MPTFASIKAALARAFGLGETEAHELVDAVLADAAPVVAQAREQLTADFKELLAEAVAELKAAIAAGQGGTPTPAEPAAPATPAAAASE